MGEGEGVNVEVVLSLDDALLPCDDLWGVTEELPLVELFGDVVAETFLNTAGTVEDFRLKIN